MFNGRYIYVTICKSIDQRCKRGAGVNVKRVPKMGGATLKIFFCKNLHSLFVIRISLFWLIDCLKYV